jgi:catechol 2,3-dioxygenase-like lactoylglutathione lyase family enzyme
MAATNRLTWGHININVRDLDRSVAFYRLLGFEELLPGIPYLDLTNEPDPRAIHQDAARALRLGGQPRARASIMQLDDGFPKLDLTEYPDLQRGEPLENSDLGIVRVCLASRDLAADYERLSAAGVHFLTEPVSGAGGMVDMVCCADPDGTIIELLQLHPEKWPSLPGGRDT